MADGCEDFGRILNALSMVDKADDDSPKTGAIRKDTGGKRKKGNPNLSPNEKSKLIKVFKIFKKVVNDTTTSGSSSNSNESTNTYNNTKLKTSGSLSQSEISRYKQIFKIFKSVVFPGPEADELESKKPVEAMKEKTSNVVKPDVAPGDKKGWLNSLLGLLGLGSLLGQGGVFEKFIKPALSRFMGRLGTNLKEGLKRFGERIGKFFTNIWKGLTKTAAWKSLSSGLTKGFDAIKEFASKAKNLIMDKLAAVGKFIKNTLSKIPGISKIMPGLAAPKPGAPKPGAPKPGAPKPGAPKPGAPKATTPKTTTPKSAAPKPTAPKKPGMFSRAWSSVKKGASSAKGAVSRKVSSVASSAAGKLTQAGQWVGKKATSLKDKTVKPLLDKVSKQFGTLVKGGGILKYLKGFAKVPIIAPLLEGIFLKSTLNKLRDKYEAGDITQDEYRAKAGEEFFKSVGGVGGAAIGGAIGSLIPVPVVGTLAGAIGGDLLGRFAVGLLNKHVLKGEHKSKVGEFILGLMMKDAQPGFKLAKNEMQDFIIRDGLVAPFSSKDEVLGMKKGGVINNLVNEQGEEIKLLNAKLIMIAQEQTQVLREIAYNTLNSRGGQTAVINTPPPPKQVTPREMGQRQRFTRGSTI